MPAAQPLLKCPPALDGWPYQGQRTRRRHFLLHRYREAAPVRHTRPLSAPAHCPSAEADLPGRRYSTCCFITLYAISGTSTSSPCRRPLSPCAKLRATGLSLRSWFRVRSNLLQPRWPSHRPRCRPACAAWTKRRRLRQEMLFAGHRRGTPPPAERHLHGNVKLCQSARKAGGKRHPRTDAERYKLH
ncbi:hypothetical protein KCP71_06670 [Salmonella enterica subsp. enterica]|nr:hypothetical protein KCP71_06670 [Salmonella enterica subsp. enterica]